MKSIFAIAALIFALSICNLGDRFSNRNSSDGSIESSNSQNSNNSNSNSSSDEGPGAASSPGNENRDSTNSNSKMVSGGILNGKAISLPKPVYPPVAKAAKASGTVVVQVIVDETGKVISAKAVSGHPLLQASAVQAAFQARFAPTLLSGKPVKVSGTITYNFEP